jgi:hypothetical protein
MIAGISVPVKCTPDRPGYNPLPPPHSGKVHSGWKITKFKRTGIRGGAKKETPRWVVSTEAKFGGRTGIAIR